MKQDRENILDIDKNKVIVEITNSNMVKVTSVTETGSQTKYMPFADYANLLISTQSETFETEVDIRDTPILPAISGIHTVMHREISTGAQYVILLRESTPLDLMYHEAEFKQIGMPKLLFAIKVYKQMVQSVYVYAVKDFTIKEDTELYMYPFSNVSGSSGNICFGANRISELDVKSISSLYSVPDMFLSMPNNDDYYRNNNSSGLDFRPLLEKLQGKEFPTEWLKPTNKTLKMAMNMYK